jgi:hypothetical protein
MVQQILRLLRKTNPSTRRRSVLISKHVNGLGTNNNLVMGSRRAPRPRKTLVERDVSNLLYAYMLLLSISNILTFKHTHYPRAIRSYACTGPVIEISSFQGAQLSRCLPPSPEDGNRSSFRNVIFSIFYNNRR